MRRSTALAIALVVLAACGSTDDDGDPSGGECKDADDGRVTLVADDLRWDTDCLRAPAGALTIEVDNRDEGQNHNVHLPTAPGSPATDLEQGRSRQELDVDLVAGSYEYICDIHPNMVGTLTVAAANAPGASAEPSG
jgi:plastocyanin